MARTDRRPGNPVESLTSVIRLQLGTNLLFEMSALMSASERDNRTSSGQGDGTEFDPNAICGSIPEEGRL